MSEELEEEQVASAQSQIEDENHKVRAPSKKKYDEDMGKITSQIAEKEEQMEKIKNAGALNIVSDLKDLQTKKSATINRRKLIDVELEKLKKILPEKMCQLGQLESSLIYKSEEKINSAVQRLEYNLNVQHFKLAEEKKIVSEIDRLKRSKKTLVQYLALKQETAGIRDSQRHMREERDTYFQVVGKLNSDEGRLRNDNYTAKAAYSVLKLEIDDLYESRRQMVTNYKKQVEEYLNVKEKQRKGSWKRRDEFRKSDKRRQKAEDEVEKPPYEKHLSWCNSLINVLSRYNHLSLQEASLDSLSPASSLESEPAEEIDGQYVLLKKGGDSQEDLPGSKRPSKKNRRPRRQSSIKKITLSSDMLQQLTELGLKAPNSVSDVAETINNLKIKKALLEKEQHHNESTIISCISATVSVIGGMSQQTSMTECCEQADEINPAETVLTYLLNKSPSDLPEGQETRDTTGSCDKYQKSSRTDPAAETNPKHGGNPQSDHQDEDKLGSDLCTVRVKVCESEGKETKEDLKSKPVDLMQSTRSLPHIQVRTQTPPKEKRKEIAVVDLDSLNPPGNDSGSTQLFQSEVQDANISQKSGKPASCVWSLPSSAVLHVDSSSMATSAASPGTAMSTVDNRSVCTPLTDHLMSACPSISLPTSTSFRKVHKTLAERLSNPSSSTSDAGQSQSSNPFSWQPSQPNHVLDAEDFPPLLQTTEQPQKRSNVSKRSFHRNNSCQDHQPLAHTSNQLSNSDICDQKNTQNTIPYQQSSPVIVTEELSSFDHMLQKSTTGKPLSMSLIAALEKLSSEKWVESSVDFVKYLKSIHCEDISASLTESTRL